MDVVFYGAAKPLFGRSSNVPTDISSWPTPTAYTADIGKAKTLLAEARMPTASSPLSRWILVSATVSEPIAVLVQESLASIGIRATIEKVPGSNWRAEMAKKSMLFMINFFSGWLDFPEYFFFTYHGQNLLFNTMSYQNPALNKEIDSARATTASGDKAAYLSAVRKMVAIAYDDVPRIPLVQPYLNLAMQRNISVYTYWFHRQVDYRSFVKNV